MPKSPSHKTPDLIDTIIESGGTIGARKRNPLTDHYVRLLYRHTSPEFLQNAKPAFLYQAAVGSLNFILNRDANTPRRVRVFNPSVEKDGWKSERTIVELNTTDSPFILDSVTGEITRHRLNIYEVLHPILKLKRDRDGKITQLFDAEDAPEDAVAESSMHFQITYIASEEERARLERDIDMALHFVNLTVQDWHAMEGRVRDIIRYLEDQPEKARPSNTNEVSEFLEWSLDRNFIFLGIREYSFVDSKGNEKLSYVKKHDLGIFRAEHEREQMHEAQPRGITAIPDIPAGARKETALLEITKSGRKSIVHRRVHMDYLGVKKYNDKGEVIGEWRLLGLFTSAVYYQSATQIPIIRTKIASVLERSSLPEESHSGKALLTVMESYPRDELLQIDEDDLYHVGMGIVQLGERPHTKLFTRRDRFGRFMSCIVYVPRDRFNTQLREKMQAILEESFGGEQSDYYAQITESALARIHYFIQLKDGTKKKPDLHRVEFLLEEASTGWVTGLHKSLVSMYDERTGEKLYLNYVDAFPESFKGSYHFGGTARDIFKIEEAYRLNDVTLDFYQREDDDQHTYHLKLFHASTQVTLSEILPILENLGFKGIDERTFFITPAHQKEGLWVHHFRLKVSRRSLYTAGERATKLTAIKQEFEDALLHIWHKDVDDDGFNKLIVRADMKWRDVVMLRAYGRYIVQTAYPYSCVFTASVLGQNPAFATLLVDIFHTRFNPKLAGKTRDEQEIALVEKFNKALVEVKNVAEDRVLRQYLDTIRATLRTNFFQSDAAGNPKRYISFKFNSKAVPNLPLPQPYAEIFVYSPDIEGIHLRGGKVARGGLRWSDRHEDFRTEVLGLVKAQQVKNAVIVPVGSKGGFVVKHPVDGDRDAKLKQGQECYRTFLRGLLDITDNIVKKKTIAPKEVVRHDGDDPYLVVAADKGTASFSDIANGVAAEYDFWLGDAFASGGSVGYDHKAMGITARGAWVSVQRHFAELGLDTQTEDFTVLGIGDMSGDVFGNGMLLSKHIKLVAAFNHMHIFLDPTPDAAESYKERKRLFELPRSTWEDYNPKLISRGGGVFSRAEKTLTLSAQIKKCFGLTQDKLSPDELIRALLKSPIDLLWNGGIGTYVKASSERNEEVGDRANDALRVSGKDLRCRVVGEGGNLGFTQLGRIEYARTGGKVNTDAIDNSAGVDCSDHEVNIKIALRAAMENGSLTLKARNTLLESMTDEVAQLVLRDNILQTQAISIAEQRGYMILESNARLMRQLEADKLLDRAIEFLPDDEEIMSRQAKRVGLTRPEMAVTLAYAKLTIYDELVHANLPGEPYFDADLMLYFPEKMRAKYKSEIENHPLRREIVATSVANSIVNRMGCTFFFRMKEDTGMQGCDVARAYTVARDTFRLRELWHDIEHAGTTIPTDVQTKLYLDIRRLVERTAAWFLRNSTHPLDTGKIVSSFSEGIAVLEQHLEHIVPAAMKEIQEHKYSVYVNSGVPKALARRIAGLHAMAAACDIVHVAKRDKQPVQVVGKVYYALGNLLKLSWLRERTQALWSHSHWDNLGLQTMAETLYDQQMRLASQVVRFSSTSKDGSDALAAWEKANAKTLQRYDHFITDLMRQDNITAAMVTVAIQRITALAHE